MENNQKPKNFEMAMQELEQIVQHLQNGNLPLEESLNAFKRGIELSQYCQESLKSAEKTINELKESGLNVNSGGESSNG